MRDIILPTLRDCARSRRDLVFENLALRQQFLVLERRQRSPNLRPRFNLLDRTFWVLLSRWWSGWRRPLRLVKPQTVIMWHRKIWRMWWRWRSRSKSPPGRPKIPYELIRRMSLENPTWGAPRIHGELIMLGYHVCESTVARYMVKRRGRPTQNWKTFLRNHLGEVCPIPESDREEVGFDGLTVLLGLLMSLPTTRSPAADAHEITRMEYSEGTPRNRLITAIYSHQKSRPRSLPMPPQNFPTNESGSPGWT